MYRGRGIRLLQNTMAMAIMSRLKDGYGATDAKPGWCSTLETVQGEVANERQ